MFKFIPKNVGHLDQVIRLGISSCMIYAGLVNKSIIQDEFSSNLLGAIGVILLFTVIMRCCPLYCLVDWNTCRDAQNDHDSS